MSRIFKLMKCDLLKIEQENNKMSIPNIEDIELDKVLKDILLDDCYEHQITDEEMELIWEITPAESLSGTVRKRIFEVISRASSQPENGKKYISSISEASVNFAFAFRKDNEIDDDEKNKLTSAINKAQKLLNKKKEEDK